MIDNQTSMERQQTPFWDNWFDVSTLPDDLKDKLTHHDLNRLGQRALGCMAEPATITPEDLAWAHAEITRIENKAADDQ